MRERAAAQYAVAYLARRALLKALAEYDRTEPPTRFRGELVEALLYLERFKQPPPGYEDDEPMEGPEDWFGVL